MTFSLYSKIGRSYLKHVQNISYFPETMLLQNNITKCICVVLLSTSIKGSLVDFVGNRLQNGTKKDGISAHIVKKRSVAVGLIEKYNYTAESHEVETADGYLITCHRIARPGKPVVLLQHGLLGSSDTWLMRGPGQDLAFLLSDEGYDVWINNIRGNVYSRKHRTLNPDTDKQFWDFSFHEMGYYDLPAVIDHILNVTKEKSLVYIGHSMGTTVFFILCSTRPEYNSKISLAHALSPAVLMVHKRNGFYSLIMTYAPYFKQLCKEEQIYELLPLRESVSRLVQYVCNDSSLIKEFCFLGVFTIAGFSTDSGQMNKTMFSKFSKYFPAGTSLNTVLHFHGNIITGSFRQMNYGQEENIIKYGQKLPPEYNLKKVTVPVILYYGDGDGLVTKTDTEALAEKLPNLINVYKVPYTNFNHIDFILGKDAKELLYDSVIKFTQKYV